MEQPRFSIKSLLHKISSRLKKPSIKGKNPRDMVKRPLRTKQSISSQILIYFIITVLIAVSVVGLSSYYLSNRLIERNVRDASEQTIIQAGRKLDYIFDRYNYHIHELLLDKNFTDSLRVFDRYREVDSGTQYVQINEIRKTLTRVSMSDDYLDLHLINVQHGIILSPGFISDEVQEAIFDSTWYQKVIETEQGTVWIGGGPKLGQENEEAPTYTIKFAKSLKFNLQKYVLLFELDSQLFHNNFADISFGDDRSVKIVDENNQVVFSFNENEIGEENNYPIQVDRDVNSFEHEGELVFQFQPESTEWYLPGADEAKELTKDTRMIMGLTVAIMIAAFLVSLLIGRRVGNMVGVPLGEISALMEKAENGDLRLRSDLANRKDEIGALAASFNQMLEKIAEMMQRTRAASHRVLEVATELTDMSHVQLETAREVASASEEISSGALNLSEKAENGNQLASTINNEVQNVYQINQEMESYAREIQSNSLAGVQKMDELMEQTKRGEEMTGSLRDKTDVLRSSTNQINEIISILTNIAEQTNLLALNAAIEAARAGDAGRGFAVVADEIRKLSAQSQESIEKVGQITSEIIQNISETLALLEEANPIFADQVNKATETHEIFDHVEKHINQYMENIEHISRSIKHLLDSQENLYETISDVSATAQESSAISEELTAYTEEQSRMSDTLVSRADELKQLSEDLQKLLDNFKV